MLEPPLDFEMFLVASNYASGLTNIKNKTPDQEQNARHKPGVSFK